MNMTRTFAFIVALEAGLGLIAIVLGWVFGVQVLASLHLNASGLLYGILATLPMLAGYAMLDEERLPGLKVIHLKLEELVLPMFRSYGIGRLAVVSAAAGFGEEVLFRGFVQSALSSGLGGVGGLVVASVIFGLAHPITRLYIVLAGVIGFYLGAVWMLTDNLLVPILGHGLYDLFALRALVASDAGQPPLGVASDADQPAA